MTSPPGYEQAPPQAAGVRAARADWDRRIYTRLTDTVAADPALALAAPVEVVASGGAGHVRLDWQPVAGAAGYLVERTDIGPGGQDRHILHHGGSDVPAVTGCRFADTSALDDVEYSYRIAAVAGADQPAWTWSSPVTGRTSNGPAGDVGVHVDAATTTGRLNRIWRMVGSERLTQLTFGTDGHGHPVGEEFEQALALAHDDLGVTHVRAHAVLHDDNQVVTRAADGTLRFGFDRVDAIYDRVLGVGLRPVVELSFMPSVLARDPAQTVFGYRGIISPPTRWSEWGELVGALAHHLVDRYGIDEVAEWAFEVWNEPNLVVFWSGTQAEYLRLYDEAATALKIVHPRLRVGGPATAAGEWVEALTSHAHDTGVALDFVSTHTYGNLPLDTRPALRRHGLGAIPVWWTEWGVGSTHFGPVHDSAFGAPFMLSGYLAAQCSVDALAYWVISDHFEELGRPERLFHHGFGLLALGNLRKPRYWAAHLAAHLGDEVLACTMDGDGAGVLVEAWATRHEDGTIDVLVWNGTLNADLSAGASRLDRHVQLSVTGLDAPLYQVRLALIDQTHSNVVRHCPDDVRWPDDTLTAHLQAHDGLSEQHLPDVAPRERTARWDVQLPMPGVARIRLSSRRPDHQTEGENRR